MNRQKSIFFSLILKIKSASWYEPVRRSFWRHPDRIMAAKATFIITLLAIPFLLAGKSFIAVTLALGALAGALSETDDHPKGRIKALILKVSSFAVSSLAVALLYPYTIVLGIGLAVSTIFFILIGGLGERYRGVMFGALLVGIYAMIGAEITPAWYLQPILLPAGALIYGLFSLAVLWLHPWRLIEEQLGRGFIALSKYLDEKAKLFPSDEKIQGELRTRLALLNVQTVAALDRIKEVLNSYRDVLKEDTQLQPYLRNFILLQSLHERAASSHERYDLLSADPSNRELLEGIGQTLRQLSYASKLFAESLLTDTPYHHPVSLEWMVNALNTQSRVHQLKDTHPLALLIRNLTRSNTTLKDLNNERYLQISPRLAQDRRTLWQRLKDQLSWQHPRFLYAIRLSICFLIGYSISEGFDLAKGEWIILTILFVLQPTYSATRRRLYQRVLGTLTGVVFGVLIVQLLTVPGQALLMFVSAFFFFAWLKRNYSVSVVFITIFVLCAFNLIANRGVAVMLPRLIDTVIGASLAIMTIRLLWPDWQYKRLPKLLAEALAKNTVYFQVILKEYRQKAVDDDLEYRIARREAHRADNALALAWQAMQVEPKRYQQFRDQAFKLTWLNHALLSYLSAFGAHREQQNATDPEVLILSDEVFKALEEAGKWLSSTISNEKVPVEEILEQIRHRLLAINKEKSHQQFIFLYNIAEVTGQLLREVRRFQGVTNSHAATRRQQTI